MTRDARINAVAKSFKVVDVLNQLDGATTSEIAERLNIPVSSAHDHLQSLETVGMVVQRNQTYHLSLRFLKYGESEKHRMPEFIEGQEYMQTLADETGEHVGLLVEQNGRCILLHLEEGPDALSFRTYPGVSLYMHTTAGGKAILSKLDQNTVENIIKKHGLVEVTPQTITDRTELFDELETIREQGFAIDESEILEDVTCIAAPIEDIHSDRVSALSICVPATRLKEDDSYKQELQRLVMETANIIQVQINYSTESDE